MLTIPQFGSYATIAAVKAIGDRLQMWVDEAIGNKDVEVFHDGLRWYVKGGTREQQEQALSAIDEQINLSPYDDDDT